MYCTYCGNEIDNAATVCDHCGNPTAETNEILASTPVENPVSVLFGQVLGSKSFLTGTVLFTVATALSFLASIASSGMATIPILNVITIIALFLLRSRANNCVAHFEYAGPLKALRVVTVITNVFIWIATVCFAIAGGLFVICSIVLSGSNVTLDEISQFAEFDSATEGLLGGLFSNPNASFGMIFTVLAIIFIIVAVVLGIIAILIYGRLAKFLKAAVLAANTGEFGELDFSVARKALVVHGAFLIISSLSSLFSIFTFSWLVTAAAQVLLIISVFTFAKILGNIKKQ